MNIRTLLLTGSLLAAPYAVWAQAEPVAAAVVAPAVAMPPLQAMPAGAEATSAMQPMATTPAAAPITDNPQLDMAIHELQNEWAMIKYQETNEDTQLQKIEQLATKAASVTAQYPAYAEPRIWQAIILSTQAGMDGGLGAMSLAEKSKELLEKAKKINPNALDGSAYTSLGSLYYKVPGWPIGFGDNDKARAYLEQARAVNPNGIDPNFFYGDFLIETGHPKEAIPVLEHALQSAPRPGREVADAGRRQEITMALNKAREEAGK